MKKVCFVLLCQQYIEGNASKGFSHAVNQRLHQWQDYYSFTSGYNNKTGCSEWEQCIIYIDNNRIICTDYKQVRVGKRNDILLGFDKDKSAKPDTIFGIMFEALELARSNEHCEEEMILHILCDAPNLLNMVLEDGLVWELVRCGRVKKRYGKIHVDLVLEASCQNRENFKVFQKECYELEKNLKNLEKKYSELDWHFDFEKINEYGI